MIIFKGKEYDVVCNMYVLHQYCKRIGENNLTKALNSLATIGGADGIQADGIERWSSIFYEMLLAGAKKNGEKLDLTFEDCFDSVLDAELIETVTGVIVASMPNENTVRPSKKKAERMS